MGKLTDDLNEYIKNTKARFHMPGHNGETLSPVYASAPYDVTELGFNDNLNCPNGTLKELEKRIANISGTKDSLVFTSGTTTAIFVGLGALRKYSKKIAIDQFSHKSVFEAARMWNYDVTIIPREYTKEGIAKPLTSISEFMDQHPDIKIVSLTTPDYLGFQISPDELYRLNSEDRFIFIDSAHGAHLRFYKQVEQADSEWSPDDMLPTKVADIVCESWHKTLPVYTGGSVLQICNDRAKEMADVCRMLRAKLHTTSPSYVTLSSFDAALDLINPDPWTNVLVIGDIDKIREKHLDYLYLDNEDYTKLTINVSPKYFEDAGIIPETSFGRWTSFIITPFNKDKLPLIDEVLTKAKPIYRPVIIHIPKAPKKLPRKIKEDVAIEFIEIENSLGRISATDVGAYPPGVPVLFEGQKITKSHIKYLLKTRNHSFNLVNGKIAVVKE